MPRGDPPADCPSIDGPKLRTLRRGTLLWRIHRLGDDPSHFRRTGAIDKRADPTLGAEGRFDCQRGEYGYIYAGETRGAAIAEAFLRGGVIADPTTRFLAHRRLETTGLARLELTSPLSVIDLRGVEGLGSVGQDGWLTHCDEPDYPQTQRWAAAIRGWAPDAHGMVWTSKRDDQHFAIVLFDDHGTAAMFSATTLLRFDEPTGEAFARKVLARFNVAVS
jgi:hypothetical protein